MQGDPDVLRLLNEQLTSELTAINQYFLHSKMQDNWGFTELAAHTRAESFDEMRHAEEITDRILLLDVVCRTTSASVRCVSARRSASNLRPIWRSNTTC